MTSSTLPLNDWTEPGFVTFATHRDARGVLGVVETDRQQFPFDVKRAFWIDDVPARAMRGGHAHRTCAEVVIALRGSLRARVTSAKGIEEFMLDKPTTGLYIPAMVWCEFFDFSPGSLCLCLASHPYEREGYINTLDEFLKTLPR